MEFRTYIFWCPISQEAYLQLSVFLCQTTFYLLTSIRFLVFEDMHSVFGTSRPILSSGRPSPIINWITLMWRNAWSIVLTFPFFMFSQSRLENVEYKMFSNNNGNDRQKWNVRDYRIFLSITVETNFATDGLPFDDLLFGRLPSFGEKNGPYRRSNCLRVEVLKGAVNRFELDGRTAKTLGRTVVITGPLDLCKSIGHEQVKAIFVAIRFFVWTRPTLICRRRFAFVNRRDRPIDYYGISYTIRYLYDTFIISYTILLTMRV